MSASGNSGKAYKRKVAGVNQRTGGKVDTEGGVDFLPVKGIKVGT